MGGPCEAKRRILGCVAESILLYAAPIWGSVLEINKYNTVASDKDVWLHKLLPDITPWYERSCGEIGYYLTQTMTAHGSFQSYVRRIGKAENDICLYCSSEIDNAEHTIFRCPAWADIRNLSEITVRAELRPENIVQIMMEADFKWEAVESMVEKILKRKEQDNRQRGPNTQQH
ncbi:uncharacterized protein LOC130452338 [Diorhabda sublineata]|uniref:uncharacterized protein LOC130440646 n=1 Tax=Diorhabda sublineata TaxID=1163346 RepID=UPI0024E1415B|nr:uncharacterized protein LOC130440646 [Diorhabda sublineata]XP_056647527.1 uncharacterized protein LOC130452338 [Diorhabda sublineata]